MRSTQNGNLLDQQTRVKTICQVISHRHLGARFKLAQFRPSRIRLFSSHIYYAVMDVFPKAFNRLRSPPESAGARATHE